MNKLSIFGELVTVAGKRDELVSILQDAEKLLLAKNIGCQVYSVNISPSKPTSVFVFEIWDDEDSHQNSLKDEQTLKLIMKAKPIIQEIHRHYTLVAVTKKL